MPEYLRSLVIILVIASTVFYFAKGPATAMAMSVEDFVRRRNVWLLITIAGFISQSYWIFTIAILIILAANLKDEKNKVALFFFIILAIPFAKVEIPGFAGIRYLIAIDYLRIISVVLLFPVALECRRKALQTKQKAILPDVILAIYVFYNIVLVGRVGDFVAVTREAIGWLLDVVLPYYAISRYIRDIKAFREVFMSLVVAGMISALVAVFEISKSWMLYESFGDALSLAWTAGYTPRGDYVRAVASTIQPIVLGYVLAIVLGIYLYFYNRVGSKSRYMLGLMLLAIGEIAPLSKGPWVGLVILLFIFFLTGPSSVKDITKLGSIAFLAGVFILVTGMGNKFAAYLPFMGNTEDESVTYRTRLFDVSMDIIIDNPVFGSTDFYSRMEELRTGAGIIDPVNHYIGISLYSGLVGLLLFALFFTVILYRLHKQLRLLKKTDEEHLLGRIILSVLISVLFMISAVSSIGHIPILYYCLAAFAVAYIKMRSESSTISKLNPAFL